MQVLGLTGQFAVAFVLEATVVAERLPNLLVIVSSRSMSKQDLPLHRGVHRGRPKRCFPRCDSVCIANYSAPVPSKSLRLPCRRSLQRRACLGRRVCRRGQADSDCGSDVSSWSARRGPFSLHPEAQWVLAGRQAVCRRPAWLLS